MAHCWKQKNVSAECYAHSNGLKPLKLSNEYLIVDELNYSFFSCFYLPVKNVILKNKLNKGHFGLPEIK